MGSRAIQRISRAFKGVSMAFHGCSRETHEDSGGFNGVPDVLQEVSGVF